jgi:hypothetical protein
MGFSSRIGLSYVYLAYLGARLTMGLGGGEH